MSVDCCSDADQDYHYIEEDEEEETAMIIVKFSNNHEQTVQLNLDQHTVTDALNTLALRFGLTDSSEFVKEWGLTPSHDDLKWIDKLWLHNGQVLRNSQVLLLGKRLFSPKDELNLLTIPHFIRDLLYCQLLQMYLEGALFCSAFKAVKLSALAAHVHVCTNDYLISGKKWLQSFLPPRLVHHVSLPSLIDKNMKDIGQRNLAVVQTAFIKGLMRLDTFGLTMYTINIEHYQGVLGIGFKGLFWLDINTFEPLKYWSSDTVHQAIMNNEEEIQLNFTNGEQIHFTTQYGTDISLCLSDVYNIPINGPSSYTLETGGGDNDSHNSIEIVDIHKVSPNVYLPPTTIATETSTSSPKRRQNGQQRRLSPFGRHTRRRQAFRKRRDLLTKEDSVEDLSEMLGVDFCSIKPSWSVENGVSPVYDSVASTRVDSTLKLARLTSSALSATLRWNRRGQRRPTLDSITIAEQTPPPLPPKPFQFKTSLTVQVKNVPEISPAFSKSSPVKSTPPTPSLAPPTLLPLQDDTSPQRLGMYLIDGYQTPADGQKSRLVQPNEALKDYATLRREFRMFCIKLPSGAIYWELASLYQPIHKLIARLCILIHTEQTLNYELFVEGTILSQLKENTPQTQDVLPNSDGQNDFPCINGMESMGHAVVSRKNLILPVTDKSTKLDSRLTFKDHGITTSRLLSLRSEDSSERLPRMAIKVPDWVKFHQCWLSIVHGNQPSSLQDATTLAAALYQCYVLDRTEFSSVISSCNITDFLPIGYSCVKGIEHKILKERQKLLSYSRKELEQIYIRGVTSSPLHQAILFPCKEPRRQFLSSSKLSPIILGVNNQGLVRVDPRTCQMLDVWNYELFKNWGYSRKSFLIEFESSTYPVKCNQGKWMSLLIDFYVKGILELKNAKNEEISTTTTTTTNDDDEDQQEQIDPEVLRRPYFILDKDGGGKGEEKQQEERKDRNVTTASQYFVLEKVYEELLQFRDSALITPPPLPPRDNDMNTDDLYVNPRPNQSLIHPNEETSQHMAKLGLKLEPIKDHQNDDEQRKYWALVDSESSSDWETTEETEEETEQEIEQEIDEGNGGMLNEEEEEDLYDDIVNVMTKLRFSKRQTPIISEHVYYLPPDCY